MVLESASFSVAQNKSKSEVDFENRGLVGENAAELFAEGSWTDLGQAKIAPILKSVVAAKSGSDLWPVLSVHVSNVFLTTGNKVRRDENGIRFPARTSGSS